MTISIAKNPPTRGSAWRAPRPWQLQLEKVPHEGIRPVVASGLSSEHKLQSSETKETQFRNVSIGLACGQALGPFLIEKQCRRVQIIWKVSF